MTTLETFPTIPAKTILSGYSDGSGWFGNNYNMNLYKGCCHGCIYCDSRSECYHVDNFDTVRMKKDALIILEKEMRSKKHTGVIGNGAMSDPYNPFEKELKITRGAMELADRYGYGWSVITKSPLVTRDIDLFERIKEHSPVLAKITITTPRDELSRKIEPHVAPSSERFAALKKLSDAGIYCGALLMPVLPFIEDSEEDLRLYIEKTAESGAKFIFPEFGVTLRMNQREYFLDKLDELYPDGEMRKKYEKKFGTSYECGCEGYYRLREIVKTECKRYGLLYEMGEISRAYKVGYYDKNEQMSLF